MYLLVGVAVGVGLLFGLQQLTRTNAPPPSSKLIGSGGAEGVDVLPAGGKLTPGTWHTTPIGNWIQFHLTTATNQFWFVGSINNNGADPLTVKAILSPAGESPGFYGAHSYLECVNTCTGASVLNPGPRFHQLAIAPGKTAEYELRTTMRCLPVSGGVTLTMNPLRLTYEYDGVTRTANLPTPITVFDGPASC